MIEYFDVAMNNITVGQAKVMREGLYYHIVCQCKFSRPDFYKILININDQHIDLGLCVPENSGFVINTRIPCHKIEQGRWRFVAQSRATTGHLAVLDNMPLPDFALLPYAKLVEINNTKYMEFTD